LRARYNVNLVAIRRTVVTTTRNGEATSQQLAIPQPDEVLGSDDLLVLIGATDDLERMPKE
jgi:Trk K+ transport system NAD-binding subunit